MFIFGHKPNISPQKSDSLIGELLANVSGRIEDSLGDHWDHIKDTNIQVIGVPEEEEKKERY